MMNYACLTIFLKFLKVQAPEFLFTFRLNYHPCSEHDNHYKPYEPSYRMLSW